MGAGEKETVLVYRGGTIWVGATLHPYIYNTLYIHLPKDITRVISIIGH